MAFITHYTLQCLFNDNQLHLWMHTSNINSSLHLSLTSCLGNHLMEMLTFLQLLFLASTRTSTECFTRRWSFNPHPSKLSFLFTLKSLGSSPNSSTLARQWSFTGTLVFCFHFFFLSRVMVVHLKKSWRWRDSIPRPLS